MFEQVPGHEANVKGHVGRQLAVQPHGTSSQDQQKLGRLGLAPEPKGYLLYFCMVSECAGSAVDSGSCNVSLRFCAEQRRAVIKRTNELSVCFSSKSLMPVLRAVEELSGSEAGVVLPCAILYSDRPSTNPPRS